MRKKNELPADRRRIFVYRNRLGGLEYLEKEGEKKQ